MTKPTVLDVEDLSFQYGDVPVLQKVSFSVKAGEFVGIIGPNGGGKTTLFKLILGFLKPTQGKIQIFGQPPQQARKDIAYVPQSLRFDKQFPLSVLDCVLMGRLSHLPWYGQYGKEDKEIAFEALKTVGLEEFSNRSFGTLSTGQAQRALIARALASQPKLLLLDEPTANVDPQSEADLCTLFKTLSGSMTLLMVTHDLKTIVNDLQRVICVQREATVLKPEEVCEHFAYGVYHPPLVQMKTSKKEEG